MKNREAINRRMEDFSCDCARLGLKHTYQRMEIFRIVISTEEHPDAVTVYKRAKKRIPTISLDTVYRNLKLLAAHGLLSVVGTSQEHLRFDANPGPHHHFTCVKCHRICDFASEVLDGRPIPDEAQAFGRPLSQHLEIRGICMTCLQKEQRKCRSSLRERP